MLRKSEEDITALAVLVALLPSRYVFWSSRYGIVGDIWKRVRDQH